MTSVSVESRGAVLWIRLNRPDVFNAFNEEMGMEFISALNDAADPSVRAVVVTGEGKAFCAGEDLRALASSYPSGDAATQEREGPDLAGILRRRYNPAILQIRSLGKPVIAAINGVAAGAGVALALTCDLRVMSDAASLVLAFAKVGLVPDSGATWLLPRYVGVGLALELAMSSDPMPAERALELGLVNKVVPPGDVDETAFALASALAEGPTLAFGSIKKLVWEAFDSPLVDHLDAEAAAQGRAGSSKDHSEGVQAFLGKRSPSFKGR